MVRSLEQGRRAAAAIFLVDLLVLAVIACLYGAGHAVAIDSVCAMTPRTGPWLASCLEREPPAFRSCDGEIPFSVEAPSPRYSRGVAAPSVVGDAPELLPRESNPSSLVL